MITKLLRRKKDVTHKLQIRKILPSEYSVLEDIMHDVIFCPNPSKPHPKDIIYTPKVRIYWEAWGEREGDHCLIAVLKETIIGAVWVRVFSGDIKGFGYVGGGIPELAIALKEPYRGKGIGTQMMERMIALMKTEGYQQISISVSKGNPALRLYKRMGFRVIADKAENYVMVLFLT